MVLLHAPWDYTQDLQAFTRVAASIVGAHAGVQPLRPCSGHTTHKSYLLDLAAAGPPVPLTRLLPSGQAIDADELQATFGTSRVVAKPAVGAGGRGMSRLASVDDLAADPLVGAVGVPLDEMIGMLRTADGGELMRRLLGGMLKAVIDAEATALG